jgi:glycosyltransferase involved in cell wall biosynthesis
MQKTNFPFVAYVADDASTDGTQEIIGKYAKKYPNIIRPILNKKNLGVGQNALNALRKVDSKYLAICDGDDFWLDENKLQKQVDFLEKHEDYVVVCSNALFHYRDGEKPDEVVDVIKYAKSDTLDFAGYLHCRAIASCTAMVRWHWNGTVPEWIARHVAVDFAIFLYHSAYGKIKILPDVLAQYNIHSDGVSRKHLEQSYQKKLTDIIRYVDRQTSGFYNKEVRRFLDDR